MTATSFRLSPNQFKPGDVVTLKIEGLKKPADFVGKTCIIKLFEVETRPDSRGGGPDLLAVFEAGIKRGGAGFEFGNVVRQDSNPAAIPVPPARTAVGPGGSTISFARDPDYKIPYLNLVLDSIPFPHIILIKSGSRERERYVFELAIEIWIDGAKKFSSTKHPTRMDCIEIFVGNCVEATRIFLEDHKDMIAKRRVGTHFGSDFGRWAEPGGAAPRGRLAGEPPPTAAQTAQFRSDASTFGAESSSCIVYLHDVLKIAHEKIQCGGDWKSIVGGTGGNGMPLALNLEKWSWIGIYYNPDTRNPFDRKPTDESDTNWQNHTWSFRQAKRRADYYKTKVHALVVDYRPTTKFEDDTLVTDLQSVATRDNRTNTVTPKDSSLIGKLNSVPFGILNARGGTHTAIFMSGEVWEVHWAESQRSLDVYEATNFERDWAWLDGIIHVPRGTWT